ncbi:hypothetical protein [Limnoglobus roseus]|uniref:Glycosyltransferase RgtA/B/C/D-like domain-containing protein n=1 Tax=Limnoglobus roseus TaxID=2598579 RepID=A0A5C1APA9_9BACT|nr:hypothetical protein [Limnoglobus roseus]QEL21001.1 hypothetical protein PX52LOC_08129 [Limnoglobus roseus]
MNPTFPASASPLRPPHSAWRSRAKWLAGYALFALLTHTHILHRPMQTDDSLYLRFAQDWAAGSQLYADRYEAKSPVVFWAFRTLGQWHPRLAYYLVGGGLTALAAFALRRALTPLPLAARAVPLIYIAATAAVQYPHLYGVFLTPMATLAIAWTGRAVVARSPYLHPAAGGVAFAIAVNLFPPAAVLGLALLPLLAWNYQRNGFRFTILSAAMFLVGGLTLTAAVVLHAMAFGYWNGLLDAMAANTEYGRIGRETLSHHVSRWWWEVRNFAQNLSPLLGFIVVTSLTAAVAGRRTLPTEGKVWLAVGVLWLLAVQLSVCPGGRHFTHYYYPLAAPLALLGGIGLAAVVEPRRYRQVWRIVRTGFVVAVVGQHYLTYHRDMLAVGEKSPHVERTQIRYVAEYVRAKIPADQTVLVSVWGPWAELYWQVPRPAPSRHVIPFNLAETRPEFFEEWAEDVLRNPPDWVIADDSLFGPAVSEEVIRSRAGGFGGAALVSSPAFARLRAYVRENYELATGLNQLSILKRKSLVTPGTPRS